MPLKITLHATQNHLKIEVPQVGLTEEKFNLMGINTTNMKIVAIGESPEEFKKKDKGISEKDKATIQFVNPFDFNTNGVDCAEALLWYHIVIARQKTWSRFIQRYGAIEYDLWLDNYEEQLLEHRQKFEYRLTTNRLFNIKKLTINGLAPSSVTKAYIAGIKQRKRQDLVTEGILWVSVLVWVIVLLLGWGMLMLMARVTTGLWTVDMILVVAMMVLILLAGTTLGITFWAILMRKFVPLEIIEKHLPQKNVMKYGVNFLLKQFGYQK